MILILNTRRFLDSIDKSIKELGFEYSRKKVTYYNPISFSGELSLHHKDEKFKYQNEYRILITPTNNSQIKIPIPGLKEFCTLIETKDLKTLRTKALN
jgi:hypothetical protein